MCTVTWLREAEGFTLLFSRDELLTRSAALGPVVHCRGGLGILAPIDPEGGGTWLAVNQSGLALGLVNGGPPLNETPTYRSRGLLVLDAASCRSTRELETRLSSANLARFRPFTLLALDPRDPALVAHWNGTSLDLHDGEGEAILCSAPHEHEELEPARAASLRQLMTRTASPTATDLARFHESHAAPPDSRPPCL
ncbi:MAG TPA: NRDE family protein, partial [Planctomycetota bacterium]|nr:NRDE family protein [Planctomycetota bacterium]